MTMKKIFSLILVTVFLVLSFDAISQGGPPPPPVDPSAIGGSNPPVGGNAPVGSGLIMMLALGAAYGIKKYATGQKEINSGIDD